MTPAESAFLKAEAVAVFGWNMGGSAQSFYEQGIRLSFEQWGVAGADAYMSNVVAVPGTYTDPAGTNSYNNPLTTLAVAWDEGASAEEKQERIMIQKWIANFPLGNESWADIRRQDTLRSFHVLMLPTIQADSFQTKAQAVSSILRRSIQATRHILTRLLQNISMVRMKCRLNCGLTANNKEK
jgi:hypothetical protein